jgi:hypothetical protein
MRLFLTRFGALTGVTSNNVLVDLSLHAWPPIVSSDEFLGFVSSCMSCSYCIMVFVDYICAKSRVSGNIESVLVCNKSVSVINPVCIVGVKSFECLSVVFISA